MEMKKTEEVPAEPENKKEESKVEIVFNRLEVHGENDLNKIQKKKEKRKAVKGNITPLTGKNYKQLLTRLETRKNKLDELKEKDKKKAQELETKIKWTNALYKAEGVKIRDDEERLKEALKRKEKRKAQRKRQWDERTVRVVEKMQQLQDKRKKNIQKKKKERIEKKKARARKKGRVLPEDLKKAGLKWEWGSRSWHWGSRVGCPFVTWGCVTVPGYGAGTATASQPYHIEETVVCLLIKFSIPKKPLLADF